MFQVKNINVYGTLVCLSVLSGSGYYIHLVLFLIANMYAEISVF